MHCLVLRERRGSGGLPGLQNRARGDDVVPGGFDSHTLPPIFFMPTEHPAPTKASVRVAILTISDSRTEATDTNGQYLKAELERHQHQLTLYQILPDEPQQILCALDAAVLAGAQIILFNGGTGIARRDTTFDTLSQKIEKPLPGFGELFRMLSWEQVGAAAMLSRATAGVYQNSVVFSTPGSHKAVQLAWEKLICPELSHLASELTR
jgi:molybdopterin adenylyltransferase